MIVKVTIHRFLGSSDDKEKIGVARPEGIFGPKDKNRRDCEEIQVKEIKTEIL